MELKEPEIIQYSIVQQVKKKLACIVIEKHQPVVLELNEFDYRAKKSFLALFAFSLDHIKSTGETENTTI